MSLPTGVDRRSRETRDRRRNPRGGRRGPERRARGQRLAWLFAAYVVYLGVRTVPAVFRRIWGSRSS